MHFIMHFKEQLGFLDPFLTYNAKLPDTARHIFLQTAVDL